MNREIKFRAWDGEKMITSFNFRNNHEGWQAFINQSCIYSLPIMQFTGCKDQNGIEIFEGDLFQYHNRIGIIKYSERMPCFVLFSDDVEFVIDKYILKELTILGNIFANPEKLKKP